MSYSDELPTPGKKPRGYSTETRTADRADPNSPPPTPHDPLPVSREYDTPIPAPRQSVPVQAPQRVQNLRQQVSPVGNQNQNIARVPSAPPRQEPRPAASAPHQPPRQSPVGQRVSAAPAAPAQPAASPAPRQEEPSTIQVGQERPKQPIDRSTLSFASGSTEERPSAKDLLLDTDGLVKIYDGRTVVNGVNINVKRGEIVGLLGPNGAGKTTSFYMMVGLVPPNGGTVMFDGKDVTKLPMYKRARLGMGYLPQEESIFRKLTVEENLMAVMQTMKYSRKEKKARCDELLERFSITHIRKNIAMTCSGGEKRRVTIARSLVPNPSLIMLDEPFGGVDPIAVNEIQGIVQDLRKDGLAVLITDHNARQTLELVDRAYLIYEGRVLREGPKEFLVNDPVSRELYLGDRFTM